MTEHLPHPLMRRLVDDDVPNVPEPSPLDSPQRRRFLAGEASVACRYTPQKPG